MKKKVYYLETLLPTTQNRLEEYLRKHNLFDGYQYKYPFVQTKLFAYLRTKPIGFWQSIKMAFEIGCRTNRFDSEVRIYKAAS